MNSPVHPELPIVSIVRAFATAAMGYSAPSVIRPESTYKSGKVVQTNGATSLLQTMAKVELTQVPYKGGAQVATSLLGGEVELAFLSVTALKSVGAGRIKALAVTCGKRDPGVPNVPTFAEAGVAGYDASFWYGLLAPAGTSSAIVGRLNQSLRAALADTSVSQPLVSLGLIAAPSSPQEFSALIRRDYEKWKRTFAGRKTSAR